MKIILNHTLRSIRGNIGQAIVIFLTILIATMLIFVALSLGDIFYNFQYETQARLAQDSDITIQDGLFSSSKLKEFKDANADRIEYIDEYLIMTGLIYADQNTNDVYSTVLELEATDLETFIARHKDALYISEGVNADSNYPYPGIWISEDLAKENGYKIGTAVNLYVTLYGRYETFSVTYIFKTRGVFANSTTHIAFVDFSSIGASGIDNIAYIKLKDGVDKVQLMTDLETYMANPELTIKSAIDYDYINDLTTNNTRLLAIALVFVIVLVIFILYSSYVVIAKKRANELIVFKSAGATPSQTLGILLLESLIYGIFGGLIGIILARFIMQIIFITIIPSFIGIIKFTFTQYLYAFLAATGISILSALVPMLRLVKNSVKALNADTHRVLKKKNLLFLIPPVGGLVVCLTLLILGNPNKVILTIFLVLSAVIVLVLISPYIMALVSMLFKHSKGSSNIASYSIKRNQNAISIATVIAVIMTFTFLVINIVNTIIGAMNPYINRFKADFVVQTVSASTNMSEINEEINNTFGVDSSYEFKYEEYKMLIKEKETNYFVYGVDSADSLNNIFTLTKEEKDAFNLDPTSCIVSYDLLNRLNLSLHDTITLTIKGIKYSYKIIAIDPSITSTDRMIYINNNYTNIPLSNSMILINTNKDVPNKELYIELRNNLASSNCYILKYSDYANAVTRGLSEVGEIMHILQAIVIIVSILGVFNLTLSLNLSRAREKGIYKSTGMDTAKYTVLLIAEGFVISLTAAILGLISSVLSNFLLPEFAILIDRFISVGIPYTSLILFAGVIIVYTTIYTLIGLRRPPRKVSIERNLT